VKRNGVRPICNLPFCRLAVCGLAVCGLLSCSLFVDVPVPTTFPVAASAPAPLTQAELLRFAFVNLGEIAPGFAYRSKQPSRALLDFLADRCNLGRIVTFRGGPSPIEEAFARERGVEITTLRMSAARPPTPRQILELIRATEETRASGQTLLLHCRAGADRAGVMTGIWRQLYQDVRNTDALKKEAFLHYHQTAVYPNVYRTIGTFRPELFRPFLEDPTRIDDPEHIAKLEAHYMHNEPLLSGNTRVVSGALRAGVAKRDLLEGWSGKIPMATYGPRPGEAQGIAEAVFARALVLEVEEARVVIVSCDLLIIDPALRERLFQRLEKDGIAVDDVLLSATHTHTSVGGFAENAFGEFYILNDFVAAIRDHLVTRMADAVAAAVANVRPARLGVGRAFAEGIQFNRRLGETTDREVGILRLVDASDAPLAVVVNFGAHPVLEPDTHISPDYPGLLCRALDERHGFGLFLQGALGDVNAHAPGKKGEWRKPDLAQAVADELLKAVEDTLATIPCEPEIDLGAMTFPMELPPAHASPIPDLLFPLDCAAARAIDWPERAPVQTLRIGPAAIVACATEASARLGLQIKRRSPSNFPFVVTHAGGYAGYAVTQVTHARRKLDPTSLILNSSRHGTRLVETACDLLQAQWGGRLDPFGPLLSPAAAARLQTDTTGLGEEEQARRVRQASQREAEELLIHVDPTQPQSRHVLGAIGDSGNDRLRLEIGGHYLDRVRGGDGRLGRKRETTLRARVRLAGDFRVDTTAGYLRSDWRVAGGRDGDEGLTDLLVGLERPFLIAQSRLDGNALRALPRIELSLPTGDPDSAAPFAFAAGAGVWRPGFGGALEFNWETYRTLRLESLYRTALDRYRRRRPGDRWEGALGYSERHGAASLHLGLHAAVQLEDSRRGGRRDVDVDTTSFALGLRPALSWHFDDADRLEIFVRGHVPIAHSGGGASEGRGVTAGAVLGF